MKIQQIPRYLWSKYPHRNIQSVMLMASIALVLLVILGVSFPIPSMILAPIFLAGLGAYLVRRNTQYLWVFKSLTPEQQIKTALEDKLLMTFNRKGDVINNWKIINLILQNEAINAEQKFTLLSDDRLGSTLLMGCHNAENVDTLLKVKGVSMDQKFQLFSQKNWNKQHIFTIVNKEVISAILNTPEMRPEQKFHLMAQTNDKGENALGSNFLSPEKINIMLNVPEITTAQKMVLVNSKDKTGRTTLSNAISYQNFGGTREDGPASQLAIILLNIENMSIDQKIELLNPIDHPHFFCTNVIRIIPSLKKAITLEEKFKLESTALLAAATIRNLSAFEDILKDKSDEECFTLFSVKNKEGYTPLLMATQNNGLDIVKTILTRVPKDKLSLIRDVADPDNIKQTAIHFADRKGRTEIRNFLQDNGAKPPTRKAQKPK